METRLKPHYHRPQRSHQQIIMDMENDFVMKLPPRRTSYVPVWIEVVKERLMQKGITAATPRGRIYISGAITSLPLSEAIENFEITETVLRQNGWEPISPIRLNKISSYGTCPTWEDAMQKNILALKNCESIYMQAGWKKSAEACIEHEIAMDNNMNIYYELGEIDPVY